MYGKTPLDTLRIDEVMGLWFDQMKTVASHRFPKSESEKVVSEKAVCMCVRACVRACVCACVRVCVCV